jgi:hypothetical protein
MEHHGVLVIRRVLLSYFNISPRLSKTQGLPTRWRLRSQVASVAV